EPGAEALAEGEAPAGDLMRDAKINRRRRNEETDEGDDHRYDSDDGGRNDRSLVLRSAECVRMRRRIGEDRDRDPKGRVADRHEAAIGRPSRDKRVARLGEDV